MSAVSASAIGRAWSIVAKLEAHLMLSRIRRQVAALRSGIKGVRFTCAGQKAMSHFRALLLPRSQNSERSACSTVAELPSATTAPDDTLDVLTR